MDLIDFLKARLDEEEPLAEEYDWGHYRRLIAAQRAIVDEHYVIDRKINWTDSEGDERESHQPVCVICVPKYSTVNVPDGTGPCRTVRLLASVCADHPDYRQGWKP